MQEKLEKLLSTSAIHLWVLPSVSKWTKLLFAKLYAYVNKKVGLEKSWWALTLFIFISFWRQDICFLSIAPFYNCKTMNRTNCRAVHALTVWIGISIERSYNLIMYRKTANVLNLAFNNAKSGVHKLWLFHSFSYFDSFRIFC